jgi:hypothetical protein
MHQRCGLSHLRIEPRFGDARQALARLDHKAAEQEALVVLVGNLNGWME